MTTTIVKHTPGPWHLEGFWDLLEASQEVLALVQDTEAYVYIYGDRMREAVKQLRAAIAKANGA